MSAEDERQVVLLCRIIGALTGYDPTRAKKGARVDREKLGQIDLHWHDLRHGGACRLQSVTECLPPEGGSHAIVSHAIVSHAIVSHAIVSQAIVSQAIVSHLSVASSDRDRPQVSSVPVKRQDGVPTVAPTRNSGRL